MQEIVRKALIFHSNLGPNPPADELDVLNQAAFFEGGLNQWGIETRILPFYNDLEKNIKVIQSWKPDLIVNLVETIFGNGKLLQIAPALFEHLSVPFTGCSSQAIYVTSNKLLSKQLMMLEKINTPDFFDGSEEFNRSHADKMFLIKSLWEHASYGMDEHVPLFIDKAGIIYSRLSIKNRQRRDYFAEQYIEGREFNVSVIGNGKEPVVLPVAEIRFVDFPSGKPRIVGYRAKWDEDSFEYKNTVRHFPDERKEPELIQKIKDICTRCWKLFDLRGYARIDFRMDKDGNLYVLEVNANPCISQDSGFVAAARQMGLNQRNIVQFIIRDSI